MNKTIINIILLLLITAETNAQCKTKLKIKSKQNCTGIFLMDKEINPDTAEVSMALVKNFEYGFYLFSTLDGVKPSFKIYNSDKKQIVNFKEIYNTEQNYTYIKYKSPAMGEYTVVFDVDKNKKNCSLFSFYLQTDIRKQKNKKNKK